MHPKLQKNLEINQAVKLSLNSLSIRSELLRNFNNAVVEIEKMDCEFKWPDSINFDDRFQMYDRHAIAKRGCNLPVNLGWMDHPDIIEGEESTKAEKSTAWEAQTRKLFKKIKAFKSLKSADLKQRVGHYSAILIQVRGSQSDWDKPLGSINTSQIVKLIPVYEGQLKPLEQWPSNDERYPMPKMYQFNERETQQTGNSMTYRSVNVHASRVITLSETADCGELEGIAAMDGCYNNLLNINRVLGSAALGIYRANAMKMILKSLNGKMPNADERTAISSSIDEMISNTNASGFVGNMDIQEMSNNLPTGMKDIFMNDINMCAANFDIPATVLIGQQTGRLASDEDSKSLAMQSNARRNNWQSEAVESLIDWLDKYCSDYKKPEEISIVWSDMLAPSYSEKLDMLKKAVESDKLHREATQGEGLLSGAQLRNIAEFEEPKSDIDNMIERDDADIISK